MYAKEVWYSPRKDGCRFRLAVKWNCTLDNTEDFEMAARDCAEDFHSNHDGWESVWPIEFVLYASEDGPELARVEIERDVEPVFTARRVQPNG